MDIQWFPGHMTKAVRMMEEDIKLCDVLIYVIDSRAVVSSFNPVLNDLVKRKKVIYVFNKSDLVENVDLNKWLTKFKEEKKLAIKTEGTISSCKEIVSTIKLACGDALDKFFKKGVKKHLRAMVVGIPNSGKSTIINSMRKKASAVTGDKAGVTRGKQWLSLDSQIDLLDTPGTLWSKFQNQEIARHLAYIGSIKDDILDISDLTFEFLKEGIGKFPKAIEDRYNIKISSEPLETFENICISLGFKLKGGDYDYERSAKMVIDDFRKGRLGKIMLEKL